MKSLAILIVATGLACASPLRAGTPKTPANHAAEAMHKQAQHEQQLYQQEMKRQQEMQNRMVHQQQEAYKQQMKVVQQQQHQARAMQQAQTHTTAKPADNKVATQTTTTAATPAAVHHSSASTHHGSGYRVYTHRNNRTYRHHTQWPTNQVDPETAALHRLKAALDGVARGTTTETRHTGTLATALGNVVEVERPPTMAAVRTLAGHLASGLTHRESANVNTATMALSLRAAMNSTILSRSDLNSVINQHKAALRSAKFQPGDITAIETALGTITTQERAIR